MFRHLSSLSELCLFGLLPDGIDLSFYLGDFFHVAASLVVRYLSRELVDLLLFLPVKLREPRDDGKEWLER